MKGQSLLQLIGWNYKQYYIGYYVFSWILVQNHLDAFVVVHLIIWHSCFSALDPCALVIHCLKHLSICRWNVLSMISLLMDSNPPMPVITFQYSHPRIKEEWWLAHPCFLIFEYNHFFTYGILDDCVYIS